MRSNLLDEKEPPRLGRRRFLRMGMLGGIARLHGTRGADVGQSPRPSKRGGCLGGVLFAADRSLDWLDQRLGALRSGLQMHVQDKTNRRLNMLTILSAIFMPITLLAGIWGMNFATMPELCT